LGSGRGEAHFPKAEECGREHGGGDEEGGGVDGVGFGFVKDFFCGKFFLIFVVSRNY
jgi:hypothetical protein